MLQAGYSQRNCCQCANDAADLFQVRQKVPAWCYAVCLCSAYQTMLRSLRGNMPAVHRPVHKAAPWAQRVG